MNKKYFHVDVTRRYLYHEVNNDMCHTYYYLVYVRIYNADRTRYRKAKFIVWVNGEDVCEFVDADTYKKSDIANLVDEIAYSEFDVINSYDDTKDFYDFCNRSIQRFNAVFA